VFRYRFLDWLFSVLDLLKFTGDTRGLGGVLLSAILILKKNRLHFVCKSILDFFLPQNRFEERKESWSPPDVTPRRLRQMLGVHDICK